MSSISGAGMKLNLKAKLVFGICSLQFISFYLHAQLPPEGIPPMPPSLQMPLGKPIEPVPGIPISPQEETPKQVLPSGPVLPERAMQILDFWFGPLPDPSYFPEDKMEMWLNNSPEVDRQMRENYAEDVMHARRGEYNSWRQTPRGRLALIILLDLIPRHIFRGTPQAYSSDPMARGLAIEGMQTGEDRSLFPIERALFYLPLENSEDMATQNMAVAAYQRLFAASPPAIKPVMQDFLIYALRHQEQIARFGRFPARNAVLGRVSSPEEILFLQQWRKPIH